MKISEQEFRRQLIELYQFAKKKSSEAVTKREQTYYDGFTYATEVINFICFGVKKDDDE